MPPTLLWTYSGGTAADQNSSIDKDQIKFKSDYPYASMSKGNLIDVNGDGLVDWVVSYNNYVNTKRRGIWINNGSRWVPKASYDLPSAALLEDYWSYNAVVPTKSVNMTRFEDVNGDGLVDLVQAVVFRKGAPSRTTYQLRNTWLNTGSGWKYNSDYKMPDYILDYSRISVEISGGNRNLPQSRGNFVDVNGDGLVDWVRSYKDGVNNTIYKYTWLNNGKGWTANRDYDLRGAVISDYSSTTGNHKGHPSGSFFDINRDGLVDWVTAYKSKAGTTVRNTYLNTGSGWSYANVNYKFPNILIDNKIGWERSSVSYGGIMDLNGDGAVDYLMSADNIFGSPVVATYLGRAKPADMVVKITDSLKAETTVQYKSMMDRRVYLAAKSWLSGGEKFRARIAIGPSPLVSNTWQSNGIGGNYRLQYHYYHGLSDGKRGYLGFKQRRIWDPQQKIETIKDFYQEFPVTGVTKREMVYKADSVTDVGWLGPNSQLLNYQINFAKRVSDLSVQGTIPETYDRIKQPSGLYTHAPRIRRTRTSEYGLDKGHIRSHWIDTGYDTYLNPTVVTTATIFPYKAYESIDWANTFWKRTTTQYDNRVSSWLIGMPTEVKVTHHAPGKPNQVRTTQTIYNSLGQPNWMVVEPNKPEFKLTTRHNFDGFGNQIGTLVFGSGIQNRYSTVEYDAKGMHAISKTNALGHSMAITPDPKCDTAKNTTDANGLITKFTYDQYCRQIRTDHPDSTWTTTVYGYTPLRVIHRAKGQPDVTTYYDLLGRDIKVETKGFDGRLVTSEKRYNWKGQITQSSLPSYESDTVYWTKYYYDAVGRLYLTRAPDNSDSRISYNGLTTTTTNPLGQTQTRISDLSGQLKTVRDTQGNEIQYAYDSIGNLLNTTDPKGNQVKMGYDHAGRKIWMTDPDMGQWTYEYDVLGQLVKQTDAKNQDITSEYDLLGRMIKRTVQTGTVNEQVSTWAYDSATNGLGKLAETAGPDGYLRRQTYDSKSRPWWTSEWIDGKHLTSRMQYNSDGKLHSVDYPGSINASLDHIVFKYNAFGYLNQVHDYKVDATGNAIRNDLWVAEEMDAKGNITQERYGNGVNVNRNYHYNRFYLQNIQSWRETGEYVTDNSCDTGGGDIGPDGNTNCQDQTYPITEQIQNLSYNMDAIGNLVSRSDIIQNISEHFQYDNLNRLTNSTNYLGSSIDGDTGPDGGPLVVGTSSSSITYQYDVLGNMTYRSDVGIMNYGENGYGPHAITSIQQNASANITENVFNPYGNYSYDANGNLTSNGQRSVDWTAFNKPRQMAGIINGEARGVSYTYGSDFQRITKTTLSGKSTRYYGGGSMEHITEDNQTFYKYYIPVGAATLEIKYEEVDGVDASQPDQVYNQIEKQYLFKDNLGSTDVIVDDNGNIVERLSFNPWGERRDADWTEADGEITSSTNRGFTGHEMDDEIGLVNMNARIYDPVIGRFLSPDALIPSPTDLQSYNRYSYVRNNPLSFTDPSGFAREDQIYTITDCGECRDGWNVKPKADTSHIIRFPGSTGSYDSNTGKIYNTTYAMRHNGTGRDGGYIQAKTAEVTDPGQIAAISVHLQVGSEIIQNYGGLSRGNSKETRNKYRALAAANEGTAQHQDYLDRAYAADQIYKALKRKARRGYFKAIAITAFTAGVGSIPEIGATVAGATGGAIAGDPKAALLAIIGAGYVGPDILSNLKGVTQIAAHGVWGGVSSEILGGGFVEGFAGAVVGKKITQSFNQKGFHWDNFAASVAGGAIAAEIVGGNGAIGAASAAFGYLINQLSSTTNQALGQALTGDGGAALAKQLGLPERAYGSYADQYGTRGFGTNFTGNPYLDIGYQDRINNRPQNFPANVPSINNEAYGVGWNAGG